MQKRVALLISGTFCTSSILDIKAITSLIHIHLYLQKLNRRFHLRALFLLSNHIIKSILKTRNSNNSEPYQLLLKRLMLQTQVLRVEQVNEPYIGLT